MIRREQQKLAGLLRDPAQHQPIEPAANAAGSSGNSPSRICACSSSRNDRSARCILRAGNRRHQRMAHVDLEDRLGDGAAVLLRQQPLQLRSRPWPPATRQDALVVSRCEARTSDTRSPSVSLITAMVAASSAPDGSLFFGLVVEQRDQPEIDIALAQRFQRLAAEIERRRGPERIDRIGQQQHLDAAGGGRFQLGIGLQPLDAVADEIIDLGLVRLEVSTYCFSERFSPAVVVKRDSASSFSRRSKSS